MNITNNGLRRILIVLSVLWTIVAISLRYNNISDEFKKSDKPASETYKYPLLDIKVKVYSLDSIKQCKYYRKYRNEEYSKTHIIIYPGSARWAIDNEYKPYYEPLTRISDLGRHFEQTDGINITIMSYATCFLNNAVTYTDALKQILSLDEFNKLMLRYGDYFTADGNIAMGSFVETFPYEQRNIGKSILVCLLYMFIPILTLWILVIVILWVIAGFRNAS